MQRIMHIALSILNISSFLHSFLFQSVWLCYSGHVLPEHAHSCSSTDAFWLCYYCQGVSRTCGGAWLFSIAFSLTQEMGNEKDFYLDYISNIYQSVISSLSYRGFHIRPVMVSGQNGHHLLKEVAWPRQPFVVGPLSPSLFLSVFK